PMIDPSQHIPLRSMPWSASDASAAIEEIVEDAAAHFHAEAFGRRTHPRMAGQTEWRTSISEPLDRPGYGQGRGPVAPNRPAHLAGPQLQPHRFGRLLRPTAVPVRPPGHPASGGWGSGGRDHISGGTGKFKGIHRQRTFQ